MKKMYKIVVFIPESHTEQLIDAMSEAGAGKLGSYTHCAHISKGIGTWKPEVGAKPYIGEVGKLSFEPEAKVEMLSEPEVLEKVIEAVNKFILMKLLQLMFMR